MAALLDQLSIGCFYILWRNGLEPFPTFYNFTLIIALVVAFTWAATGGCPYILWRNGLEPFPTDYHFVLNFSLWLPLPGRTHGFASTIYHFTLNFVLVIAFTWAATGGCPYILWRNGLEPFPTFCHFVFDFTCMALTLSPQRLPGIFRRWLRLP